MMPLVVSRWTWALAACLLLAAAACGQPARRPQAEIPRPHHPQVGIASWYGRPFHGRLTASGERFNMHDLTAAHRTLPFHTRVRVTNLDNGKQVVVRINDRGPFRKGRIIDLSMAAARKIAMLGPGLARVRLEVLR
ncbi:MAG: septal ring lytic transglycosylase RlpA family protein [Acidobacteriota bacterium]